MADRWECSQGTGLPAWRHQDLHITANRAHGITGTQTEESVLRYWSRLDLTYEHVYGGLVGTRRPVVCPTMVMGFWVPLQEDNVANTKGKRKKGRPSNLVKKIPFVFTRFQNLVKTKTWLPHPCRIGEPLAAERGAKSEVAHKWANWLPHPCRIGEPHRCRSGGKIRSGPQVNEMATSPLPYRGSPPLQSGGQNQKWPTSGQIGYLTPAVSGIPSASERGAKSEVAHKWAKWLPHPCRIGEPHRCRAGDRIRSGPQVGEVATSPLPYRGAPPLHSGGQNQKWPTSGQSGYLTPAVSGIPTAAERGAKSEVAHKWAKWLPHPCRIGEPHHCRAGGKTRSGPQVGEVATSPLPYRGAPPLTGALRQGTRSCRALTGLHRASSPPYMGLVGTRRPVVCPTMVMGFSVPLHPPP